MALTTRLVLALSVLVTGCSVGAGLSSFGATASVPVYRTTSAPQPEYQASEEPVTRSGGCSQEFGRDTGKTLETAGILDAQGVEGCVPEDDEHDAYVADVERGAYIVTLRALNDIPLHMTISEVGGKRLAFESIEGDETTEARVVVKRGKQLLVKVDAFHYGDTSFGRYQLTIRPE